MPDQQVRYVVYIDGVNQAKAGLLSMEVSANRAEQSVTSLNGALRSMAGAVGLGLGLHGLIRFGEDALEGAADYETAVKRIKFASDTLEDGMKNISFISAEADKFRIPLQQTTDTYGEFLAMLSGSDMAGEQVRKLHDELLLIGKVKGISDGQMDAAVRNIGKMLEAGGLDARHFRPLEQQLSGIGAFVAKELGMSVHQLAILRNKGMLTQVDPKVLLSAIEKQAESLKQFLPEATTTLRSEMNDLSNSWLRFKNDLVFDNKDEIKEVFTTLREGVQYLFDHRDDLERIAGTVVSLGKAWLGYKVAMSLANIATAAHQGFMAGYAGESAIVVSAAEAQAIAFNSLALAVERVAFATEALAGVSLTGVTGLGLAGIPLANAGLAAGAAGAATGVAATAGAGAAGTAAATGATIGSTIGKLALPVAVMYFAGEAMAQMLPKGTFGAKEDGTPVEWWNVLERMDAKARRIENWERRDEMRENPVPWASGWGLPTRSSFGVNQGLASKYGVNLTAKPSNAATDKVFAPTDRVTGQRVITYNYKVGDIIAQQIDTQNISKDATLNTRQIADEIHRQVLNALHDSQIRD